MTHPDPRDEVIAQLIQDAEFYKSQHDKALENSGRMAVTICKQQEVIYQLVKAGNSVIEHHYSGRQIRTATEIMLRDALDTARPFMGFGGRNDKL